MIGGDGEGFRLASGERCRRFRSVGLEEKGAAGGRRVKLVRVNVEGSISRDPNLDRSQGMYTY